MKPAPGQKLTLITISSWMAHTVRHEIQVVSVLDQPIERLKYMQGPRDAMRVGTFKHRGKRKIYFLDIRPDDLVFEGWDLPVKIDHDFANPAGGFIMSGNACFNLGGEADLLRDYIENRNLNGPVSDDTKAKCLRVVVDAQGFSTGDHELLYPEIETGHAVINRKKDALVA